MKKTYIIIAVVVVVLAIGVFFFNKRELTPAAIKKAAPVKRLLTVKAKKSIVPVKSLQEDLKGFAQKALDLARRINSVTSGVYTNIGLGTVDERDATIAELNVLTDAKFKLVNDIFNQQFEQKNGQSMRQAIIGEQFMNKEIKQSAIQRFVSLNLK